MMRAMKAWILLLLLAGCSDIPRDPDRTLERVTREHRFYVGLVAANDGSDWQRVLARISKITGARPIIRPGSLEPLLLELEEGKLDLVVGARLDAKSPWMKRLTIGPPLGEKADSPTAERLVTRNGENAWIMLVHGAIKAESGR